MSGDGNRADGSPPAMARTGLMRERAGMIKGLVAIVAASVMLGGCARSGAHGLVARHRFPALPCAGLEAERVHVEREAARLYRAAARHHAFGTRSQAETLQWWPIYIFTKPRAGMKDRQRYQQLSMSYEQLRIASRQKSCGLVFAPDVSRSVTAETLAAD